MKITNIIRRGDYLPKMLNDGEAYEEFFYDLVHEFKKAVNQATMSYDRALNNCKHLKPNGKRVAIKVSVEFGDAEDIDHDEEPD